MERLRSIALSQGGQATAEYALVILVAGLLVGVLAAFVKGGAFTELFETVVADLVERARG